MSTESYLSLFVSLCSIYTTHMIQEEDDGRSESDKGISFSTHRTLSNASTISPNFEEEEEEDDMLGSHGLEDGPSFRLGSVSRVCSITDI